MRAALGLGSNVGDRRAHLEWARAELARRMRLVAFSSLHETEPVGEEAGPALFLNAAAVVACDLSPRGLLEVAREMEAARGRDESNRKGPRPLDVDLLLCDDRILDEPGLVLPHPLLATRRFVLAPLSEIAPDWIVPGKNRTVGDLLADLEDDR